jgi:6-phosphogluconate dehydrogenase
VVTDVTAVVRSWRQGTVIRSWLLDLMVNALDADDDLSGLRGFAQDSGEGRWTVEAGDSTTPSRCRSSRRRCSPGSPPGRTTPRR